MDPDPFRVMTNRLQIQHNIEKFFLKTFFYQKFNSPKDDVFFVFFFYGNFPWFCLIFATLIRFMKRIRIRNHDYQEYIFIWFWGKITGFTQRGKKVQGQKRKGGKKLNRRKKKRNVFFKKGIRGALRLPKNKKVGRKIWLFDLGGKKIDRWIDL